MTTKNDSDASQHSAELEAAQKRISELEMEVKALRESKAQDDYFKLLGIFNSVPYVVYMKDVSGRYIFTNKIFNERNGLESDFCIGKSDHELFAKDIADTFCSNDKEVLSAESYLEFEEDIRVGDKKYVFQSKKFPVRNENGDVFAICGVSVDITERKATEKALKLNESRLEALHNLARMTSSTLQELTDFALEEAIALTESKIGYLAFMDAEEKMLTMYSWSKSAMKECRIHQKKLTYPIASTGLWGEAVRQRRPIVTNDYHASSSLKKGYPKGHVRIERHMNVPVFENEKIVAVAGVGNKDSDYDESDVRQLSLHMDSMWAIIRSWKDAKEQQRLRSYLSNIVNSMPSQLVAIDLDVNVTQWNTEAQKITGISQEEALGQPLGKILPHLVASMFHVRSAIKNKKLKTISKRRRFVEGEERYEDIVIYPLTANGVDGAVIRVDDVTERVRLEQVMMQSEKMMSIGGLAAGMAHEINTPLAGVVGCCKNIQRRAFADLSKNRKVAEECGTSLEHVRDYLQRRDIPYMLDTILGMSNRVNTIVSSMLSFSRINAGKRKEYDLAELLDSMISLAGNDYGVKNQFDFRSIEIVREYDEDIPRIFCNGNELQQVFLNLLNNGAQAMAEKKFTTDQPRFICRLKSEGQMVMVEIEDNGPGMDEKTRKRVFDPFFTTKAEEKGTGLGLSVSNFIVEDRHKGEMHVESELGHWTRFTIKLPLRQEAS